MKFTPTALPDVVLVEPVVHGDSRGSFMETWREDLFAESGLDVPFVQDNQSRSSRGVLRGLHYQIRRPQGKLVRVISGRVFDVAVDLRRSSPTFGRWAGVELDAAAPTLLWVPPGFAHGFYVLSDVAEFVYKCTDYYAPEHERCVRWDDPAVGIDWPLLKGAALELSDKDQAGLPLAEADLFD
ncbi:MAG: dTDP-4-dehydrorhamnose 3,5-epimerase [bacterium]|nr:dTDP-4-dehydrorhamnose 3,5-epimerase [bacterium]